MSQLKLKPRKPYQHDSMTELAKSLKKQISSNYGAEIPHKCMLNMLSKAAGYKNYEAHHREFITQYNADATGSDLLKITIVDAILRLGFKTELIAEQYTKRGFAEFKDNKYWSWRKNVLLRQSYDELCSIYTDNK